MPSLASETPALPALPFALRHGLVWAVLTPGSSVDMATYLGPSIDDDLGSFLEGHVVAERVSERRACNWKLVLDAFLEGYHAKYLHQRTIARFFVPGVFLTDRFGYHARNTGARKELLKLEELPPSERTVRTFATVVYFVFPNSLFVVHPDWISHITMVPETVSRIDVHTHAMLDACRTNG